MRSNRRFLALVFIGFGIGAAAACSLITDVDRSKIEGAGGTAVSDAGFGTGGTSSTGGKSSLDDAGTQTDAAPSEPDEFN